MKRKVYIKPTMEVIELESEPLMLILSVEDPELPVDGDVVIDTRDEQLVSSRRGEWGNLWAEAPEVEEGGRW